MWRNIQIHMVILYFYAQMISRSTLNKGEIPVEEVNNKQLLWVKLP